MRSEGWQQGIVLPLGILKENEVKLPNEIVTRWKTDYKGFCMWVLVVFVGRDFKVVCKSITFSSATDNSLSGVASNLVDSFY